MKYLLMACMMVSIVGCGKIKKELRGSPGTDGKSVQGNPGTNGQDGSNGEDGADGIDATSVTVVKLCPGVTVYPSRFVEIAFCISGKLYGTYSANGGFSTELPPGSYGSNGINSSCNFVIGESCEVTN